MTDDMALVVTVFWASFLAAIIVGAIYADMQLDHPQPAASESTASKYFQHAK